MKSELTKEKKAEVLSRLIGKARSDRVKQPPQKWLNENLKKYDKFNWYGGALETKLKDLYTDWLEFVRTMDSEDQSSREYVAAGFARTIAIAERLRPDAEKFRESVWGSPHVPFQNVDEAGCWIQSVYECEVGEAGHEPLMHSEITLKLRPKSTTALSFGDTNVFARLEAMADYSDISEWLEFLRDTYAGWEVTSSNGPSVEWGPTLELTFTNGGRHFWRVPLGGVLEQLFNLCLLMTKVTEFWTVGQALQFILCGSSTMAGVQVQHPMATGNNVNKIVLNVTGPATPEEVTEAYKKALEETRTRPKSLSYFHAQILTLVYLMPLKDYEWPERLRRWLEWVRDNPALKEAPMWGATLNSDGTVTKLKEASRNLNHEYKRAVARGTWTGKPPLKSTPKTQRVRRHPINTPINTKLSEFPPLPWEKSKD